MSIRCNRLDLLGKNLDKLGGELVVARRILNMAWRLRVSRRAFRSSALLFDWERRPEFFRIQPNSLGEVGRGC